MKQTSIWTACIFLCSLFAFSCTNSNDTLPSPTTDTTQIITQQGGWKVTWYWDKDKDETTDFSGYVFHFRDTGTFDAVRNGSTTSGTWEIRTSSDSSQRLVIVSGSAAKPLSNLDDDWLILNITDNKIELKDDNPDHLEELTFEPI